jgi:hypothetical protein
MRTNEERIKALHARVAALQRQRERRKTRAIGAASIVLSVCLLFMVFNSGIHPGGAAGLYSGATMLFEGAGPYVLIAVVAFMAGVIVTVAIIKNRKKENSQISENRENAEPEVDGLHGDREILQGRKS